MVTLDSVKQRLTEENIRYIVRPADPDEHWAGNVIWIGGGCKQAPLRIVFGDAQGEHRFIDLRFGRYDYELFSFSEESVMDELMQDIHAVLAGKTKIIFAWYTRTRRWHGDSCYYIAPGEEDDDSEEYAAALRRIERPRNWLIRRLTRSVTYAVYDWDSYREITR